MAEVKRYKAESGATIIICDDAYRDKTPEENREAIRRFEEMANECLYRDALYRNMAKADQDLLRA